MSNKPKTRVTVRAYGAKMQVLAIRELTDGTLAVFPATATHHHGREGKARMVSNKFSVHPSRDSVRRGRTIKHEIRLEDGTLITDVAFILDAKQSVCWPITSGRFAPLWSVNQAKLRSRDSEIELPPYNPALDCLMYTLFLKDKARELPPGDGYGSFVIPFREVDIHLYYAYISFPTPPISDHNTMSTTPRQFGTPQKRSDHVGSVSYSDRHVLEHLHDVGHLLIDRMLSRWTELIGAEDLHRFRLNHPILSSNLPFNEQFEEFLS